MAFQDDVKVETGPISLKPKRHPAGRTTTDQSKAKAPSTHLLNFSPPTFRTTQKTSKIISTYLHINSVFLHWSNQAKEREKNCHPKVEGSYMPLQSWKLDIYHCMNWQVLKYNIMNTFKPKCPCLLPPYLSMVVSYPTAPVTTTPHSAIPSSYPLPIHTSLRRMLARTMAACLDSIGFTPRATSSNGLNTTRPTNCRMQTL